MKRLSLIKTLIQEFGLRYTLKLLSTKIIKNSKSQSRYINLKYNYLQEFVENLVDKYKINYNYENNEINTLSKIPIWQFWWQGIEEAPEIVKVCIKSVAKNIDENNAEIHLITKDNYKSYVDIPDYIIEKVENGVITLTHFSDILRVCLLRKYGGIWMDATLYLKEDFSKEIYSANLFSIKLDKNNLNEESIGQQITQGKWVGFFWKANANSLLFQYLQDALFEYWKKYNYLIEYFIMNLFICIAYNDIPMIKNEIDNIPFNNPNIYKMMELLNNEYDKELFNNLTNDTSLFKLSYKEEVLKETTEGKTSMYRYIVNNI